MSKYSSLPDVDLTSQDVYESADVPDLPTAHYSKPRRDSIDTDNVQKQDAQQVFETVDVDATNVDYSDAINENHKHYRVSTIPETLEARVDRLKREVAEVSAQVGDKSTSRTMDNLKDVLDKLALGGGHDDGFYEDMGEPKDRKFNGEAPKINEATSRVVDLDQRLNALESRIGKTPVEPVLTEIRQKLSLVSNIELDKIAPRVKELGVYADKIRTAKEPAVGDDSNMLESRRIALLYEKLGSLDQMEATLPHIISRLKSLNSVHTDAANVATTVRDIDASVDFIKSEMAKWIDCVKTVEKRIHQNEQLAQENKAQIERWISNLESRLNT